MVTKTFVSTGYTNSVELYHEFGMAAGVNLTIYPSLATYRAEHTDEAPHDVPVKVTITYDVEIDDDHHLADEITFSDKET